MGCLVTIAGVVGLTIYNDLPVEFEAGAPIVPHEDDDVMVIGFSNDTVDVTAQRSASGAPFSILVTYRSGKKPRHCIRPKDLDGLLDPLARIVARRTVPLPGFPETWPTELGLLEIKRGAVDFISWPVVVRQARDGRIAVKIYDSAAEVDLDPRVLEKLQRLCDPP